MPGNATLPKPPSTFEDILLLFMRRFLAPLAAATLAIGGLVASALLLLGLGLGGFGLEMVLMVFGIPAAFCAIGILLVGLPAGYFVARRRRGYRESLGLLAAIGFGAGLALSAFLGFGLTGSPDIFTSLILSVSGTLAAGIWTLLNADLFRLDEHA